MATDPVPLEKHKNLKHLLVGLVVVGLLIFTKIQVEHTSFGLWLNARGYEVLHSFIAPYNRDEELPVVVLDISSLEPAQDGTTSADRLRTIIEALVESRAKAIALDIDFSPRLDPQKPLNTGARSEADEEFFEFLHEQRGKGVPVFVGVHNVGVESKTWLGTEDNKDLAAHMALFDNGSDSTEVHAWLQCPNNPRLNSISKALAEASGIRPQPPQWLRTVLTDYEDPENLKPSLENDKNGRQVPCQRAFTLVNYGKLELIQKLALQTLDRNSILSAKNLNGLSRFQDKLVIIGVGQRDKATDQFQVIGRHGPNESVPGVFIHAIATYTLVADPVYRFKHGFTILLDGFLGAFIVVGLFVVRHRYRGGGRFSVHLWESIFIGASIFIVLSLGLILVKVYNVLWLDFLLVILALLLHSKVQNGLTYFLKKIFKKKPVAQEGG